MKLSLLILLILTTCTTYAQISKDNLQIHILKNDSLLFEEAFNKCETHWLEKLIHLDFENINSEAGIIDRHHFINNITESNCMLAFPPRRELIERSSKIFPLYKRTADDPEPIIYGAIHNGQQRIYTGENGIDGYATHTSDFTQIWLIEKGELKLKQIIGFNYFHFRIED